MGSSDVYIVETNIGLGGSLARQTRWGIRSSRSVTPTALPPRVGLAPPPLDPYLTPPSPILSESPFDCLPSEMRSHRGTEE